MAPLTSKEDFQELLNALQILLNDDVLTDEVITKSINSESSESTEFNTEVENIIKKLESNKIQITKKPRLQCVDVKRAWSKNQKNIKEITEIIFFRRCGNNQKTLQQWWGRKDQSGFKIKDSFTQRYVYKDVGDFVGGGSMSNSERNLAQKKRHQNKENEEKCLKFFLNEKGLSNVRVKRQLVREFGFLSARMDFLIEKPDQSERIILECKGTGGDMVGKVFKQPVEGHKAELISEHQYYHQTQAYLYILRKTHGDAAPLRAAMVIGMHQEHDEDDEEEPEETDEKAEQDEEWTYYKEIPKKPKGEFFYNYVSEDMEKFEELNNYCRDEALPQYLAVLKKIFEKKD